MKQESSAIENEACFPVIVVKFRVAKAQGGTSQPGTETIRNGFVKLRKSIWAKGLKDPTADHVVIGFYCGLCILRVNAREKLEDVIEVVIQKLGEGALVRSAQCHKDLAPTFDGGHDLKETPHPREHLGLRNRRAIEEKPFAVDNNFFEFCDVCSVGTRARLGPGATVLSAHQYINKHIATTWVERFSILC
jgi:hypothetical protein